MQKIKLRNKIESDFIYHLKKIVIPNPKIDAIDKEDGDEFMKI